MPSQQYYDPWACKGTVDWETYTTIQDCNTMCSVSCRHYRTPKSKTWLSCNIAWQWRTILTGQVTVIVTVSVTCHTYLNMCISRRKKKEEIYSRQSAEDKWHHRTLHQADSYLDRIECSRSKHKGSNTLCMPFWLSLVCGCQMASTWTQNKQRKCKNVVNINQHSFELQSILKSLHASNSIFCSTSFWSWPESLLLDVRREARAVSCLFCSATAPEVPKYMRFRMPCSRTTISCSAVKY